MDSDETQDFAAYPPLTSTEHETRIKKAHAQKQSIKMFRVSLNTTFLTFPKEFKMPARQLELTDTKNLIKATLYRAAVAAYNYAFFNETAAMHSREVVCRVIPDFVNWLNIKDVGNKYTLLKEYETDWFESRGNHGGPSPLMRLNTALFNYAYEESEFIQRLTIDDANFMKELSATKISVQSHKRHDSLASYFGAMPWLRDEEVGIGSDLYRVLASPKLTISSLKALVSTVILEFYEAKVSLREFLLSHPTLVENMHYVITKNKQGDLCTRGRKILMGQNIYSLFEAFHEFSSPSDTLSKAMSLLAVSSLTTMGMAYRQDLTKSRTSLYQLFKYNQKNKEKSGELSPDCLNNYFSLSFLDSSPMFSMPILVQLSNPDAPLPITEVEQLMFSWLMATLTVQPDDIKKLKIDDFRLMKIGQKVTDIECMYFKGRANRIHTTRSLTTRKIEGKALLLYLNQHQDRKLQLFEGLPPCNIPGGCSVMGNLTFAISLPFMNTALQKAHQSLGDVPISIPKAISSLVLHGVSALNPKGLTKEAISKAKTFCKKEIFGLKAIKNSAVHANSDPYTLQYLINRNSHSNQTEKKHYLTQDNEEWINSSGRITRSVMFDLINNVFALDFSSAKDEKTFKQEVANFNFEFRSISHSISSKSEDMLARLQVVTEQQRGRISEVGVMSYSAKPLMQFAPIYILDSPVTVCKMRNYLYEFSNSYKKLLRQNPDYFYQTVLPTVEWMERVISTKLSPESIKKGDALFENMKRSGMSMRVFHSI